MPAIHRDSKGYYRLFGLQPDASEDQIQLAYEAIEEMPIVERGASWTEITRAYSVLMEPGARRAYDAVETRPETRPVTRPLRIRQQRSFTLNDTRLLAACCVLLVGILAFVWYPLYGSRFRSFTAGDALVTTQGSPFGKVVQSVESHTFPAGGSAPAYLIELNGSRELRWFPMSDIKSSCRKAR